MEIGHLVRRTLFSALVGAAAFVASGCGGDDEAATPAAEDDASTTEAATPTTQDEVEETTETTAAETTTTTAEALALPTIDAASLDPCSLVDQAEADRLLGAPTSQIRQNTPAGKGCGYGIIEEDLYIIASVLPPRTDAEIEERRNGLEGPCEVVDAGAFGPNAFQAACGAAPPGRTMPVRNMYVYLEGGGIVLSLFADGDAGSSESLDALMAAALERAA